MKIASEKDLVGRIFEHAWLEGNYAGRVYTIEFLSEKELRWKGIEGKVKGLHGTEKYTIAKISDNIFQFSWLSEDGLTVSITYNFNSMEAYGIVSNEKEHYLLKGNLKIRK